MKMKVRGTSSSSPPPPSKMVAKAIKLLLALVYLGWLLLWVMRPTTTYNNKWTPKLRTATDSTFFGRQGTNMLMFTFPVLFISVVGSFYLHTVKRRDDLQFSKLRHRLEAWKKPVIVKGPMGIFTAMELAFCLKFLALIIWALSMYISNALASMTDPGFPKKYDIKEWQKKLKAVGLQFGLVGNMCCAFLFFPVTRASSLLPLLGLTSEASIKYHVWLGHIVMTLFTAHGLSYIVAWTAHGHASVMLTWRTDDVSILAGEIALLAGLILWVTTFPRIRRKMFELFFYPHQLYIVFLVFYLLHVGMSFFCLTLPGVYLFMVDRYLRFLQSRRKVRLVSARLLPSETVELNFSKDPGFSYTPMSTVFINVPSISSLQWHPFTVNSNSNLEPDRLSVIIKKEGSWTQKLFQTLNQPSLDRLDVSVEGTYGPASVNFLSHDSLVMVSGGSGITPFFSIIRELIYRTSTLDSPTTPAVLLICSFKTSSDLTMLDLLLPLATLTPNLSKLNLRIEAFVTREKVGPSNAQKSIRTVWFKPNPSDLPISPILGPNSWLWLGAIISSSFIAFLVLLGILTHYYIYPIESSGANYSWTLRALLNLLLICGCVAVVAGGAVLWNKKESKMGDKQVTGLDEVTPTTSPGSWFYKGDRDRELESVPYQSLAQATTLHFGSRPDLKRMISESRGSSVGVMASGPSALRREVAAICSSSQARNLHFESISFNW